ncbi:MAG: ABC transporter permease [Actinomycetota bacterium]
MRRYLLGKVLQALLTLAFVLVFNFFLFRVLPGDPAALLLRGTVAYNPDRIAAVREELGLDEPLPAQFVAYVGNTLTLNFGESFALRGAPVSRVIADKLWPTVLLVGVSTIASALLGLWIGIRGGWRPGSRTDVSGLGFTLLAYAMPEFWFGILVLMLFSGVLGIFPTGGYATTGADLTGLAHVVDVLNHMVLPSVVLTVAYLGEYALIMRNSMIDIVRDDFIQTARAKGVRDRDVLWRHAVPNALLPTMTITFLSLGFVFSGAITIEYVFSWPGLGWLSVQAIEGKDYPLLQALFLLFSGGVIVANLLADVLYSTLDPRVRAR